MVACVVIDVACVVIDGSPLYRVAVLSLFVYQFMTQFALPILSIARSVVVNVNENCMKGIIRRSVGG